MKRETTSEQTAGDDALRDLEAARRVLTIEAEALRTAADGLDASFVGAVDRLARATGRVICAGVGKSGHVARKIAATLASTGTPAYFVHPTEASHGDLGMVAPNADVVLALSRSGETAELNDIVAFTRRFGVALIAMTADPNSALAAAADHVLVLPDAPEACAEVAAPTTSTTLMMALGDALAVALLRRRGFDAEQFKLVHPGGRLGAMLTTARDLMQSGDATPLAPLGASLTEAVAEMSAKGLGCVGVVDGAGALCGIVTDGDLRRMLAAGRADATVDAVMTRAPTVVAPGALAATALQIMNDKRITQLFVVEDGAPLGVLHMHDVLRAGIA